MKLKPGAAKSRSSGIQILLYIFLTAATPLLSQADEQWKRTDFYGDPLPRGAVARMGSVRFRTMAKSFELSPDGKVLLVYPDGDLPTLQACDAQTGKVLYALHAKSASYPGEPDGGRQGSPHSGIRNYGFSADNRFLAVAYEKEIQLLDKSTGKVLHTLGKWPAGRCEGSFSFDSRTFALVSEDDKVRLWDTGNGALLQDFAITRNLPERVALSIDHRLVAASSNSQTIHVWDLRSGKPGITLTKFEKSLDGFAFAPKGDVVVACGRDSEAIQVFDLRDGRSWRIDAGAKISPYLLAFSPDGKFLVVHCAEKWDECILFDLPARRAVWTCQLPDWPPWGLGGLAFSPDSRHFAVEGNDWVVYYDALQHRQVYKWRLSPTMQANANSVRFASDGNTLAIRNNALIRFFDLTKGQERPEPPGHSLLVRRLTYSADGATLVSGGFGGGVIVWDAATGRPILNLDPQAAIAENLTVTDRGGSLVFTDQNIFGPIMNGPVNVRVWDLKSRRPRFVLQQQPLGTGKGNYGITVGMSSDGTRLAAASRCLGPADLYDATTGKKLCSIGLPKVESIAFSPDGKTMAMVNLVEEIENNRLHYLSRLNLLDVATGEVLRSVVCPVNEITSVMFSPDGSLVGMYNQSTGFVWETETLGNIWKTAESIKALGISRDGTIRTMSAFRNLLTSTNSFRVEEILGAGYPIPLQAMEFDYEGFAFSPDGNRLAAANKDFADILIWDLEYLRGKDHAIAQAPDPAELEKAWTDLASKQAEIAYKANRVLFRSPGPAIAIMQARLKPFQQEDYAGVIHQLDDKTFAVRVAAYKRLAGLGLRAQPAMRSALAANPSPELYRQLTQLLRELRTTPLPAEQLRGVRCVALLEQMNTADARRLLTELAGGAPEAELTRRARASLDRLAK